MAARKRKKPPPKRATRSLLSRRPSLRLPSLALEPHHVDIIGLGMIAVGILLGGVAYLHWDGGALGNGAVTGLRFLLGALGYVVPAALVVAGGLVLMRELRPPGRPLRTGLICLTCSITLALAAGTLGVGPGAVARRRSSGTRRRSKTRGGILGQAELWVTSHLISTLGADILAVFLFVAGLILVTGATLAGIVRSTGAGVSSTTRALRRSTEGMAATRARRPATEAARARVAAAEPILPPEPDTSELVVRATHVEAPPILADLADEEPEPELPAPEPEVALEADEEHRGAVPRGPDAPGPLPRLGSPTIRASCGRSRSPASWCARPARRPSRTLPVRSRSRPR